jgi:nucleolar protein 56
MATAHLGKTPIGILAFDDNGKMIGYRLFPKQPAVIADALKNESKEEFSLFEELEKKKLKPVFDEQGSTWAKQHFRVHALEVRYVKDQLELNKLIGEIAKVQAQATIKRDIKKDKVIVQAVNAIGDLDKIVNNMTERLREWFALHYPELRIANHEKFAELIAQHGSRENFPEFKRSMGIEFTEDDANTIKGYAKRVHQLFELHSELEKYVKRTMKEVMPSTSALVGEILGARILAQAGSLEKLSKMPSSTIQVIGAEKALFRHLKGGGKSPKHGIIFNAPEVNQASPETRGKVARLLAAKLTIAIRSDAFGGKFIGDQLRADFEEKLKQVK